MVKNKTRIFCRYFLHCDVNKRSSTEKITTNYTIILLLEMLVLVTVCNNAHLDAYLPIRSSFVTSQCKKSGKNKYAF